MYYLLYILAYIIGISKEKTQVKKNKNGHEIKPCPYICNSLFYKIKPNLNRGSDNFKASSIKRLFFYFRRSLTEVLIEVTFDTTVVKLSIFGSFFIKGIFKPLI